MLVKIVVWKSRKCNTHIHKNKHIFHVHQNLEVPKIRLTCQVKLRENSFLRIEKHRNLFLGLENLLLRSI